MQKLLFKNFWLTTSLVVILAMGVFFRLDNLERKVYWHDEVYTSLRISGYNGDQARERVFTGEIVKPSDLLYFQQINPDKTWQDTWEMLVEHPEHPPLYYVMARLSSQLWGSSIVTTRGLAAVISLLIFPALFWLCWELFPDSTVGWWAIALVSISPIHILYAQEARQYSLWAVTTLLVCAAFWRAIKSPQPKLQDWLLYSLTLSLNFYTSLLSIFVAIAHFAYLIIAEKLTRPKVIIWYISASLLAVISFIPWLVVLGENYAKMQHQTNWMVISEPWQALVSYWELHLSSIWLDLPTEINHFISPRIFFILLIACIYTFKFLKNKSQENLFLLLIVLIPMLGLMIPDLLLGGRRSVMTRYFFPSILGIQIAVSYWLANSKNSRVKLIIVSLIFSLGILSCTISNTAYTWWSKISGYPNYFIAEIINTSPKPLIISDNHDINVGNLISLSYLLREDVDLLLYQDTTITNIPLGYSDVFFYNPSPEFISNIEENLRELDDLSQIGDPNLLLIWQPDQPDERS